jgi:predicted transcriptional regulator YdeE
MEYKVVLLEEKVIVGLSAMTGNTDPDMGTIIGGLWNDFYQGGVNSIIKNKTNKYAIGLYSDYTSDQYCVTVGNEVSRAENPDLTMKIIPAGKYAKFSVRGHMEKAVAKSWGEIWQIDLDRRYTGDFEEYRNDDINDCNIDIYIAIK